jgi:hypothetical protein
VYGKNNNSSVVGQGGAGVRGKKTRFGRRVVTNFTTLYIIVSHYKHYKLKLYNV